MNDAPRILLLDDGELDELARVLDDLELDYSRLRGGEVPAELGPPHDLLVATPRRAEVVRRGSPAGARPGRPTRIIAVEEDSTAMRRMLRRMGFQLLVRQPCQPEIWRLLVRRAVYQGDERRVDTRVAVGSMVDLSGERAGEQASLMDISNRGCRLMSALPLELGTTLEIVLPGTTTGGAPLALTGRVVRVASEPDSRAGGSHSAAMAFDDHDEAQQIALSNVINRWSTGPRSIAEGDEGGPQLPPRPSRAIPGLTLDAETDPQVRVGETVELHVGASEGPERRQQPRGAFAAPIMATAGSVRRVLMGRDLSAGGMRIERAANLSVGDTLHLALHGPSRGERFQVRARIMRDDGDEGLALCFESLEDTTEQALEKLVACLPDVESLEDGETHGLGAVISEILDEPE